MFLFLIFCCALLRIQARDSKKSEYLGSRGNPGTEVIPDESMITAKLMISIGIAYCHGLSALQPCDKERISGVKSRTADETVRTSVNKDVKMSPEEYIGYLSSMSFQWVTKVIVSGYKGTLTDERQDFNDLLSMTHHYDSSL